MGDDDELNTRGDRWRNVVVQANEDVTKNLQQIKAILYGDGGVCTFWMSRLLY